MKGVIETQSEMNESVELQPNHNGFNIPAGGDREEFNNAIVALSQENTNTNKELQSDSAERHSKDDTDCDCQSSESQRKNEQPSKTREDNGANSEYIRDMATVRKLLRKYRKKVRNTTDEQSRDPSEDGLLVEIENINAVIEYMETRDPDSWFERHASLSQTKEDGEKIRSKRYHVTLGLCSLTGSEASNRKENAQENSKDTSPVDPTKSEDPNGKRQGETTDQNSLRRQSQPENSNENDKVQQSCKDSTSVVPPKMGHAETRMRGEISDKSSSHNIQHQTAKVATRTAGQHKRRERGKIKQMLDLWESQKW
jgi:hypothetical protein